MGPRGRFILRRLAVAVGIALVAVVFNFVLFRALPGDAVSNLARVPSAGPQLQAELRRQFGLDDSLPKQFVLYVRELGHGNLGVSFEDQRPVSDKVRTAIGNTLPLVAIGTLLGIALGTVVGVLAAYWQGTWVDRFGTGSAMVLYAFPVQALSLLALVLLAGSLPTAGMRDPFLFDAGFWQTAVDRAEHLLLPASAIALSLFGQFALVVRASMIEVLGDDFVMTARAKGYAPRRVVWREGLRSALLPVVTLTALTLGFIVGGAVLVEAVFSWPGVGSATVTAVARRDYPMLQGLFLAVTLSVVFFTFLGDVLHALLDPRVSE